MLRKIRVYLWCWRDINVNFKVNLFMWKVLTSTALCSLILRVSRVMLPLLPYTSKEICSKAEKWILRRSPFTWLLSKSSSLHRVSAYLNSFDPLKHLNWVKQQKVDFQLVSHWLLVGQVMFWVLQLCSSRMLQYCVTDIFKMAWKSQIKHKSYISQRVSMWSSHVITVPRHFPTNGCLFRF